METDVRFAAIGDSCMDVYDKTGEVYPGGNPVNVAVHIARLGGRASYIGVVGDDAYGGIISSAISRQGVDISHLHRARGHTAVSHVKLVDGNRVFGIYDEGVMKDFVLTPADIAFICEHDCVVAAFWSRAEKYLGEIKSKGIPIAFDFADKWGEMLIEEIAQNVDYAFFSYDDIDTVEDFLRDIKMSGFNKLIIATMGVNGSIAYDGEKYYYQSAVTVPVVDTMGAGDSFIAGFLFSYLREKDIERAMKSGAECSGVTLQHFGSW